LAIITLASFWRVLVCGFLNYDDYEFVTLNRHVQTHFTWEAVKWAMTTGYEANWQPLTWMSYMLDWRLYKLNPLGYHLTNLLLHIASTVLLFLALRRMTGSLWRSAFVAALFAIHPLHVESVAWVAERKDVLSTFFWMLTMWLYLGYVDRPGAGRYLLVALALGLGLMSKTMLVTLPIVLLLLDYWPLGRFTQAGKKARITASAIRRLVWEKSPLLVLSAVASVIIFLAQRYGGAVSSLKLMPVGIRVSNALVSYVKYLAKMVWPDNLAVIYPLPSNSPWVWQAVGSALLLICVTILVIRAAGRRPYLAVGWLWYGISLLPVIGLVQIGTAAMADRYTYVPLIGIFIIIAWGVPDLLARVRVGERVLPVLACAVTAALMVCTWIQVGYWRSSITLFQHALRVTTGNYVAHNCLGEALRVQGKTDQALEHLYKALAIQPTYSPIHANLGIILCEHGRLDESIAHLREALRLDPMDPYAHLNLGVSLNRQGKLEEAMEHFSRALDIKPDLASAHYGAGLVLDQQGKTQEAIREYREAIRLNPNVAQVHGNLGLALMSQGKGDEAIREYQEAIRLEPDLASAHNNLAISLYLKGDYAEAWKEVRLCRKYGLNPHPGFIKALSQKMPEPADSGKGP